MSILLQDEDYDVLEKDEMERTIAKWAKQESRSSLFERAMRLFRQALKGQTDD